MTRQIQIGIADDHAIARLALRALLEDVGDMRVAGEAADGQATLALVANTPLDVLILDVTMPTRSGPEVLALLQTQAADAQQSPPAVLVFTAHPADRYARLVLRQGARGFLGKFCDPTEIVHAVRILAAGGRYFSSEVLQLLTASTIPNETPHVRLTEREFHVFMRLAMGERAGTIAHGLCLSVKSISGYRARLLAKLDLSSNSELTYYAIKHGLLG